MAAHIEWVTWWEQAGDLGDVPIRTIMGIDPFGWVAAEACVDGLLAENEEAWHPERTAYYRAARRAYDRLRRSGLDDPTARLKITYAFCAMILDDSSRDPMPGEDAGKRLVRSFQRAVRRIAAGE